MSENTRQEAEKTVALVDEVNAVVLPEPVEANAVVPLKDAPAEVSGEIRSRMDELDMADTNSIVSFGAGAQTAGQLGAHLEAAGSQGTLQVLRIRVDDQEVGTGHS